MRITTLTTPGALHALLSDAEIWNRSLCVALEEGDPALQARARQVLEMLETDADHYWQHLSEAQRALAIYEQGSPLHESGLDAHLTHEEAIRDGWIICFVNPARHADRLGPHYALHFLALMEAQLSGKLGRADYILDEFCNAPLKAMVDRLTVFRAFGARAHFIAQSRSDVVRKYGEKETALLEENCSVKQWLKVSNFEEAERLSRAMGEVQSVMQGLGFSSGKADLSANLGMGRQRLFTADELMRLPADEQIIYVADVGFIHARKIRQNEIAPTCFDLGDNPLEGGRLPPDPKVHLPIDGRETVA